MFNLDGKVALVTGGRRGMGRAHAHALAQQGAKVIITDVSAQGCEAVARELRSKGAEVSYFKLDVSNKIEIEHVFDEVIATYGRLDILVNNAGIFTPKPF